MGITVICASVYMWYKKTEHFPFGMREVRPLLVARGLFGFFGVFGMYCKSFAGTVIHGLLFCPYNSGHLLRAHDTGGLVHIDGLSSELPCILYVLTFHRFPAVSATRRCYCHHFLGTQSRMLGLLLSDQRDFHSHGTDRRLCFTVRRCPDC